jgi:hypothetical protein
MLPADNDNGVVNVKLTGPWLEFDTYVSQRVAKIGPNVKTGDWISSTTNHSNVVWYVVISSPDKQIVSSTLTLTVASIFS